MNFGKDVLHSDIQYKFLREYYTQTYSKIFDFILYSDVQYDFYTALGRTRTHSSIFILHSDVQYDFYTVLGRTVRFLYCTRTYSTIFRNILHSDVQCDF